MNRICWPIYVLTNQIHTDCQIEKTGLGVYHHLLSSHIAVIIAVPLNKSRNPVAKICFWFVAGEGVK